MEEIVGRSLLSLLKRTDLKSVKDKSLVGINPYFERSSLKDQLEAIDWILDVGEYEVFSVMDIETQSPSYVHHLMINTKRLTLNLGYVTLSVKDPYSLLSELEKEYGLKKNDKEDFFHKCNEKLSKIYDCKKFKRTDGTLLAYALYKKDHTFRQIISRRDKERLLSLMSNNISYFL